MSESDNRCESSKKRSYTIDGENPCRKMFHQASPEGKKIIVTPGCVNKYPPLKMRLQIVKESLIYISLNICKKL